MATYQPLGSQAPWRQLTVDASDWQQADPALLATMPVSYTHLTLPTNREV